MIHLNVALCVFSTISSTIWRSLKLLVHKLFGDALAIFSYKMLNLMLIHVGRIHLLGIDPTHVMESVARPLHWSLQNLFYRTDVYSMTTLSINESISSCHMHLIAIKVYSLLLVLGLFFDTKWRFIGSKGWKLKKCKFRRSCEWDRNLRTSWLWSEIGMGILGRKQKLTHEYIHVWIFMWIHKSCFY